MVLVAARRIGLVPDGETDEHGVVVDREVVQQLSLACQEPPVVDVVIRHRSGRPRRLPGRRGAAILGVERGDRLRIKGDLPEDLRAFGWDPLAVEHTTGQVPCCALPGHVAARTDVRPQAG